LYDAANRAIQFQQFMRGKPRRAAFADGTVATRAVDNLGNVASSTNEFGSTTTYVFDAMGRVAGVGYPAEGAYGYSPTQIGFEQIGVDEFGLPAGHWRQTLVSGSAITRRFLDGQWRVRLTQHYDPADSAGTMSYVETRYDAKGRKAFESYPRRQFTRIDDLADPTLFGKYFKYDTLDRLSQQKADSELGLLTTTTEYLAGFQRRTTNPRGHATTHLFQVFDTPSEDTISQVWTPDGGWMTIARDLFGKATSISRGGTYAGNAQQASRYYVYDVFNRLCKTIEPESGATVQAYDSANNVAWRASGQNLPSVASCDQDSVPAGSKISFGYDPRDRLATTTFGDGQPSITRLYTPDGLLQQLVSSSFTWTYGYNNRRLLTQEALSVPAQTPGAGWNFTYGIDANGHVATLTDPWGTINYGPNALGQITQVTGYASGVKYHPNGMVSDYTLANGIAHQVTQNRRGLPQEWQDVGVGRDVYTFDANGNTSAIQDLSPRAQNRSMGYDPLDRLTSANGVWGNGLYGHDALDNLRSSQLGGRSLAHNVDASTNRLSGLSGSQSLDFYYDPNGNVRQRGSQLFTFDIANRLRWAQGKARYDYDGHGRRSWVVFANGGTQLTAYTGTGPAGQLKFSNHSSKGATRYVYLGGKLIAEHSNVSGVNYAHTNALGSVVARSNAAGQVTGTYTHYEPYGAVALGDVPQSLGFTGHMNDADTGLVYMQQRYYDPIAGRFLSVDPVTTDAKTGGQFNRYVYAENNPYRYIDPDGRSPLDFTFLAVDAAKLVIAVNSGVGIGAAVADVALSAVGVASPIPGVGQMLKGITGTYKIAFKSGREYIGKGGIGRMAESMKKLGAQEGGVAKADYKAAANQREAFKEESRQIEAAGGARSQNKDTNLLNRIDSPGTKMRAKDGEKI
jgi:RHS repeat-associated protein